MNKITIFQLKNTEIHMLYRNGALAYTMEIDGKTYGVSVKPESKAVIDIAAATFQLLTNALETIEELQK